jgi:hypothetical protein
MNRYHPLPSVTMKLETERLGEAKEMRFWPRQRVALSFIADINNKQKEAAVVRTFTDFGIKLTHLNGGQIPLPEQVRLQRGFAKKLAHRRRRR